MYLEQFQYIIEVAKTKSISTAAENLHVSQSGVSRSIKNLEEKLGIRIFKRSKIGTIPTEEGQRILKKAHEINAIINELIDEANINSTTVQGILKVSAIPTLFVTILLKTLSSFTKCYPSVIPEINENGSQEIIEQIMQNQVDIGLITTNALPKDISNYQRELNFETLIDGKTYVFVKKDSPLAFNEFITPQDLKGYPFVLYNSHLWQSFINEHFSEYPVRILFRANNTEAIKKAVAQGLAVGFSTNIALENDQYVLNNLITPKLFVNPDPIHRTYGIVTSKQHTPSKASREFIKQLKREVRNN